MKFGDVPRCSKPSTIIQAPMKHIKDLNDYRSVALRPVVMQTLERPVLRNLKCVDLRDHTFYDIETNIDLETNSSYNIIQHCEYYSEDSINVGSGGFSIIHFRSRSMYRNLSQIKIYLGKFDEKCSVVAISQNLDY